MRVAFKKLACFNRTKADMDMVYSTESSDDPRPPSAPKNLRIGKNTIEFTLEWDELDDDGGCPKTEYTVEMCESSIGNYKVVDSVTGTKCLINGLKEETAYTFRVTARNDTNSSTCVPIEIITTIYQHVTSSCDQGKLSSPKNLRAINIAETTVTLMWNVSEDDERCPITGYIVEISESSTEKCRKVASEKGTHYVVDKLTNGTVYRFRVAAQSQTSTSEFVTVETGTRPSLDKYTALSTEDIDQCLLAGTFDWAHINTEMKKEKDKLLDKWMVTKNKPPSQDKKQALNLVLLGKTGAGKSATGNLILGKPHFEESHHTGSCTVTSKEGECVMDGVHVNIIDTPSLEEITFKDDEKSTEISKIQKMFPNGIDGLLFVFNIGNPRFTEDEEATFKALQKTADGKIILDNSFAILTHIESKKNIKSLLKYIEDEQSSPLGNLLNDILQQKVIAVNNADQTIYGQEVQRKNILSLICKRKGVHFTSQLFEQYLRDAGNLPKAPKDCD